MSPAPLVRPMLAGVLTMSLLLAGASCLAGADGAPATPIVVELFTSQGCSSCPPADRLLSRLGDERLPGDVEVIPLSFHVDYWNYIGWTDPFSSKEWSDRQRRYALALQLDTLYTPQIVIHGGAQVVGSSAESVLREIGRARSRGAAVAVDLDLEAREGGSLAAAVETRVAGDVPGHGLDLMVALFETQLVTSVARGENASRTLENDYVVRALRRGLAIEGRRGARQSGEITFELEPDWRRENLGVAAFAQDPATLRIHGAAARRLQ